MSEPDTVFLEQQLALLDRCLHVAYRHATEIERAGNQALNELEDAAQLATAGAFAYFIEMVASARSLIRERRLSATYTVARAALLALADLHNLRKDDNYALHMEARRIREWARFLDNAQKHPSPLVEPFSNEFNLTGELEKMRTLGNEAGDAGGRSIDDWERLVRAGLGDEYRSIYWLWSLHTHANLGAIYGAHVSLDGKFTFKPKDSPSVFLAEGDGLCGMILGAMYAISPQFGIPTPELDVLRRELSRLRAAMGFKDGAEAATNIQAGR